jgi:hypothetical protein
MCGATHPEAVVRHALWPRRPGDDTFYPYFYRADGSFVDPHVRSTCRRVAGLTVDSIGGRWITSVATLPGIEVDGFLG